MQRLGQRTVEYGRSALRGVEAVCIVVKDVSPFTRATGNRDMCR